jgi:hypothetical protein
MWREAEAEAEVEAEAGSASLLMTGPWLMWWQNRCEPTLGKARSGDSAVCAIADDAR